MTQDKHFQPLWWLRNAHVQTIWPSWFKKNLPDHRAERLELEDGDFLDLVWRGQGSKTILLLHGLEGSVESHYAIDLLRYLDPTIYTIVFIHHRGCSHEVNRLDRAYHSGETGDLQRVIEHVIQQTTRPIHAAIGYSLGGNMLLKWLGEQGENAAVDCAIAVSVPFELAAAGRRLSQGASKIYQHYLLSRLKKSYQGKYTHRKAPLDVDLASLKTFYDFDDQITAPLHGFSGADEYYRKSSSRQYLTNITKPTLIIHSMDDPFTERSSIPTQEDVPECIELEISSRGGHVGFVTGKWLPRPWLPERIELFLTTVAKLPAEQHPKDASL